jgi:molecular chaperone GrpE
MYWNENAQPVHRIPVRVVEREDVSGSPPEQAIKRGGDGESSSPASDLAALPVAGVTDWQGLALRLQADMENFRKRQTRRADETIAAERERLLRLVLPVADNLARALSHDGQGDKSLRQGIELTYRELMRLLEAEGVTHIEVVGQPFAPELHEAVATVTADAEAGTVVEELERGYILGGRLLRPARVVVAA